MKREIEPKMVAYFDRKLRDNGLAQVAVKEGRARLLFRLAAETLVGIREKTGQNDGPLIELMQETIGNADGEAWCMSLVQTCIAYAEKKTGKRSVIAASEHCLTVWSETDRDARVRNNPTALPGAIVIWRHGTSSNGHTGITISPIERQHFHAIEGNTSAGIEGDQVIRDGAGVYLTERHIIGTGKMHVVGLLKPF